MSGVEAGPSGILTAREGSELSELLLGWVRAFSWRTEVRTGGGRNSKVADWVEHPHSAYLRDPRGGDSSGHIHQVRLLFRATQLPADPWLRGG